MKFALSAATVPSVLGLLVLLVSAHSVQAAVVVIDLGAPEVATATWHGGAASLPPGDTLAATPAMPAVGAGAEVAPPARANPAQHQYKMSTVPEQSAYSMLVIGLGLLGLHMRRQTQEEKFSVEPKGGTSSLE